MRAVRALRGFLCAKLVNVNRKRRKRVARVRCEGLTLLLTSCIKLNLFTAFLWVGGVIFYFLALARCTFKIIFILGAKIYLLANSTNMLQLQEADFENNQPSADFKEVCTVRVMSL